MLIPLSWLKEYVDIKIPFPELAVKLSEAGLTVEKWTEKDGDIIFDPEVTPNRPDWLSIYGIAREISAITGVPLKKQDPRKSVTNPRKSHLLEITIKPNYKIVPRISSVIIRGVKVKPSPEWMQKRIKQIGLRPINNLVDITNYVLWTYGSLLHVFDYDKIRGHQMSVELSKGGEAFRSLDGIDYKLPKDAIIIKDVGRVIDLLPLKGGENTATFSDTKNVLLHSVIVDPVLTRRTSQALGLRSDSSAIAEKGLDPNGTIVALNFALKLILDLAGGEIASEILDNKAQEFKPFAVKLSHSHLESILGIKIEAKQVKNYLESLGLSVTGEYNVTVPTFRNDLHIEEDLIEEIARLYGYNNFPKTLPASPVPTAKVSYARNFDLEYSVKQKMTAFGYSEIYTYSLIAEKQLINLGINPAKTLRIDNPISRDFEYLRPAFVGNLLEALKLNQANFPEIRLFELGKEYQGENLDKAKEVYWLDAVSNGERFYEAKGEVEKLLKDLGIDYEVRPSLKTEPTNWLHPGRNATITIKDQYVGFIGELHPSLLTKFAIKNRATIWGINYDLIGKYINSNKKYQPIPKYPAIVNDLSLTVSTNILVGEIISVIKKSSPLVNSVELLDTHENTKTFRISHLDRSKNLTEKEVAEIQNKILHNLKEKLGVKIK